MKRGSQPRGRGGRPKGRGRQPRRKGGPEKEKPPEAKGEDPVVKFVNDMKKMGAVHCVSLTRTHMRASEDEPLNILINPLFFKYIQDFDHNPKVVEGEDEEEEEEEEEEQAVETPKLPQGSIRELGLAYRRLFQIFEETDYIPPMSTAMPFSNETIQSFERITILPGLLHYETFKEALPDSLRTDPAVWINTEDNFVKVPLTSGEGASDLFLLLGSDVCIHHEANMAMSMTNNAIVLFSLLSKLGLTWRDVYRCVVTLMPAPREEGDPLSMNRVVRMVTIMAARNLEETLLDGGEAIDLDYTEEDTEYIEGMIGWSYSKMVKKEEDTKR